MSTFVITQEEQDDINRRAMMKLREYLEQPSVAASPPAERQKMPLNPKDIAAHGRAPLEMIPGIFEVGVALALKFGANKYGPFNWRKDEVNVGTYIGAMKRHLAAFMDGEDLAPDSKLPHLAHVAAGCAILMDALSVGKAVDNRPAAGNAAKYIEDVANGKNPFNHGEPLPDQVRK